MSSSLLDTPVVKRATDICRFNRIFALYMDREQAAKILGVDPDCSREKVEERYNELVQVNHPDKGGSSELFKQINQARDTLLNNSDEVKSNSSGSQGWNNKSQSRESQADDIDPDNTYNLDTISNIELDKIADGALGRIVTTNRLAKKKPGFTHPQTLTDKPLIEYIHKAEQPHFTLRFNKATLRDHTVSPENGGFLVLTDARILTILGYGDGDRVAMLPYSDVRDVSFRNALLSHRYKFRIDTVEHIHRFKIDHTASSETGVSSVEELNMEIKNAEQFIREAAYQFM